MVVGVLAGCGCVLVLSESRSSIGGLEALMLGVVAVGSFAALGIVDALESVRAWLPAQPRAVTGSERRRQVG